MASKHKLGDFLRAKPQQEPPYKSDCIPMLHVSQCLWDIGDWSLTAKWIVVKGQHEFKLLMYHKRCPIPRTGRSESIYYLYATNPLAFQELPFPLCPYSIVDPSLYNGSVVIDRFGDRNFAKKCIEPIKVSLFQNSLVVASWVHHLYLVSSGNTFLWECVSQVFTIWLIEDAPLQVTSYSFLIETSEHFH